MDIKIEASDLFALPLDKIKELDSYALAYPHLLSYFQEKKKLRTEDIIRGMVMVYGWMPTIPTLHGSIKEFEEATEFLNRKRHCRSSSDFEELENIKKILNNSLVGASKILHFVNPEKYAIWDSKVAEVVFGKKLTQHQISKIENYKIYMALINDVENDHRCTKLVDKINKKLGYNVSTKRAIELVLFLNS